MSKTVFLWMSFLFLLIPIFTYSQVGFHSLTSDHSTTMFHSNSSHYGSRIQYIESIGRDNDYSIHKNTLSLNQLKTEVLLSNNIQNYSSNKYNMLSNKRLKYSSLWAFTALNYLYADLVGLMDVNLLNQYQTGVVNGIEITPGFLTAAAAYMQIPLANVFLPHVIKNKKVLRWVQIVSGGIATLVQGSTLLVGKPSPYYILFSAIEMGTTAYITLDAFKWKPSNK